MFRWRLDQNPEWMERSQRVWEWCFGAVRICKADKRDTRAATSKTEARGRHEAMDVNGTSSKCNRWARSNNLARHLVACCVLYFSDISYDKLVELLLGRNLLNKIVAVDRDLNKAMLVFCRSVTKVFLRLQASDSPALQHVCPCYYFLANACKPLLADNPVIASFKEYLLASLDDKYWGSIKAYHWIASFLDPRFKKLQFLPLQSKEDKKFHAQTSAVMRKSITSFIAEARQRMQGGKLGVLMR